MIEIITVFLGLINGPHSLDLRVSEPVTAVEIELDGEEVARLEGPPWRLTMDFGEALRPHRLTVVGRDRDGAEVGRAERRINLADGVTVPGREDFVADAGITAVAITLDPGTRLPAPAELGAWFEVDGRPAEVLAVEAGPAEVIFVRDPRAQSILDEVVTAWLAHGLGVAEVPEAVLAGLGGGRDAFFGSAGEALDISDPVARRQRLDGLWQGWRALDLLPGDASFRFISPWAAPVSRVATRKEVFNTVRQPVFVGDGLLYQAVSVRPRVAYLRLGDAVAVAGVEAFSGRQRRAVVALLSGLADDDSRFRPAQVRDYLRTLGVPLFAWSFDPAADRDGVAFEDPAEDWSPVRAVVDRRGATVDEYFGRLRRAFGELEASLEGQRIVWLRGAHLPQQVELTAAAGVRFAGAAAAVTQTGGEAAR